MKNKLAVNITFLIAIVFCSLWYGQGKTTQLGPRSIHMWRATDCLSITANYYHDNLPFTEPEVYWVNPETGVSNAMSEFPIIYYSVAQIWKVIGKNEGVYRLISLLIVFIGLFHLFKISRNLVKSNFWGAFIPIALFTSPILIYYSNFFIMNAPALGIALIGLYHIWKYTDQKKISSLYFACFFFLLGGLLKITSLLSFFAVLIPLLVFSWEDLKQANWKGRISLFMPFILFFIGLASWYGFSKNYNLEHGNTLFLQGILPYWEIESTTQLNTIWTALKETLIHQYFSVGALLLIGCMFIYSLVQWKKANKFLLVSTVFVFIGVICYLILFFQVFDVHDYYLINLLILLPFIMVTFFELISREHPKVVSSRWAVSAGTVLLLFLVYRGGVMTRIKFNSHDPIARNSFLTAEKEIEWWDWFHWNYSNRFEALETIEPTLRELGIKRSDRVISIPDISINNSLYLMNQKGYTSFGNGTNTTEERIIHLKNQGAKYLIINDENFINNNDWVQGYLKEKIGQYKTATIIKL